jgi:hypothetical protein
LQPRRTAERRSADIEVVGYRIVAKVDRIGEGMQPVRKVEFILHYFTIVIHVCELGMHTCVTPKAVRKQSGVQLQRMRDYVVDATHAVVNGRHATFPQAKDDGRTRPSPTSCDAFNGLKFE